MNFESLLCSYLFGCFLFYRSTRSASIVRFDARDRTVIIRSHSTGAINTYDACGIRGGRAQKAVPVPSRLNLSNARVCRTHRKTTPPLKMHCGGADVIAISAAPPAAGFPHSGAAKKPARQGRRESAVSLPRQGCDAKKTVLPATSSCFLIIQTHHGGFVIDVCNASLNS